MTGDQTVNVLLPLGKWPLYNPIALNKVMTGRRKCYLCWFDQYTCYTTIGNHTVFHKYVQLTLVCSSCPMTKKRLKKYCPSCGVWGTAAGVWGSHFASLFLALSKQLVWALSLPQGEQPSSWGLLHSTGALPVQDWISGVWACTVRNKLGVTVPLSFIIGLCDELKSEL